MFPLLLGLAVFLAACSLARTSIPSPTPTFTPSPSTVPFGLYGGMLNDVPYCATEISSRNMDIYFPSSGGPWPALVYIHGGSWMRGDKSEAAPFAYWMTSQAYIVVSINYRLYPQARFPAMIEDAKCAIRSLRAHAAEFNLDPNRIAAVGTSAGGHLAALLGTSDAGAGWDIGEHLDQSSRVQAVIVMAPVTDLSRHFPNADIETMRLAGFDETTIGGASPITHVTADDPPFLLVHGDLDPLVPYEQSALMYDRLVNAGVPAQLVMVQNAGHSLVVTDGSIRPTFAEINQIILDFLAKYLK